jgi:hypothetical protein
MYACMYDNNRVEPNGVYMSIFGSKKKYVSKEVKEQRKYKALLRERTVWVSNEVIDDKKLDRKTGNMIPIKVTRVVDGTFSYLRGADKMDKQQKKAWAN